MEDILVAFSEIRSDIPWKNIFLGLLILVVGQVFYKIVDWTLKNIFNDFKERQNLHNFRKFFVYVYNLLLFLLFLKILRVDMKVVLGATGLLTLAIGFAARTPISNLISGIFLVFERPFVVGDIIEVKENRGEVISLNLLSLTMRTLDNLMVRIPNEIVIGTAVKNISYFPIRRLDIKYIIPSKESLTRLQETLFTVAERSELALDEPEPYYHVSEFRENSVEVTFMVWASSDDFLEFRSEFPKDVHRAVKKSGIEPVKTMVEVFSQDGHKDKSPS